MIYLPRRLKVKQTIIHTQVLVCVYCTWRVRTQHQTPAPLGGEGATCTLEPTARLRLHNATNLRLEHAHDHSQRATVVSRHA